MKSFWDFLGEPGEPVRWTCQGVDNSPMWKSYNLGFGGCNDWLTCDVGFWQEVGARPSEVLLHEHVWTANFNFTMVIEVNNKPTS